MLSKWCLLWFDECVLVFRLCYSSSDSTTPFDECADCVGPLSLCVCVCASALHSGTQDYDFGGLRLCGLADRVQASASLCVCMSLCGACVPLFPVCV